MSILSTRGWTSRRFVLVAIALVGVTLAAALLFVDWRVERVVTQVEREAAQDELDALTLIARDDGVAGLAEALRLGSRLGANHGMRELADRNGAPLAGDLGAWPKAMTRDGVWTRFAYVDARGADTDAEGIAAALPGGARLLVARDLDDRRFVHGAVIAAFAFALTAAVGLTLLFGLWIDRLLLNRVDTLAKTARAVMAGRLDARAPATNGDDEFSRLGAEINAMLDRIEALMTGMRAVTDSLAHDLRTPLTRLAARLDAAADPAAPDAAADIRAARDEAERIRATFETLIDIARAESGVSRDSMDEADLGEIVADMAELFAPLAEDKAQTLHVDAPSLRASAHRALVAQAVGNLLDNAIKFAPTGGRIAVTLKPVAGGADIMVTDNGPGIPENQRAAAIARFQRLARDSTAAGSGLGLSIVAATAHLHGGKLRLEDAAPGLRAVLEIRSSS